MILSAVAQGICVLKFIRCSFIDEKSSAAVAFCAPGHGVEIML